ncbi:unnamed protein product [Oncorhynchus mykiss]|uniref:RNA 2-O ribose methyltransferase substrate binding domain-containing protein n=1 Tax=Oncorhynchus mykiss TaxID=8022 RepID=A0A060VVZ5_ONCMY|nr:unnamed protein product [Oncorhynchus mykiss]
MAAFVRGMLWHILVAERSNILKKSNDCIVDSKRYVRALKRRPVKVLYPDSETTSPTSKQRSDQISTVNAILKNETTNKRVSSMSWSARNGNASTTSEHTTNLKDQLGGLKFERALPGDKRLARVVSVACSRTFREHQGKILLEGRRLICDALAAGANPQMVFFSSVDRLCDLPLDKLKRATLVKVKFEDIKIWSDLVAPQGVIAIFSRPDPSRLTFPQDQRGQSVPLSLICDNVRDPGNLGTILRCAVAAGCHNVLLTKGCVDAWEPKVLRAAMGAHFRLPIFPSLDWDDIQNQLPKLVTVHVADNCSGSEREVAEEANQSNKPSKMGEYGWEYESDFDSELSLPRLETKLYHEGWAQGNTGLVIGGETHGLSLEAVQLAEKTAGQRLFIPVVPGVDSLNSAMAASILLFEGRRQLLNLMETSGRKAKVQFP